MENVLIKDINDIPKLEWFKLEKDKLPEYSSFVLGLVKIEGLNTYFIERLQLESKEETHQGIIYKWYSHSTNKRYVQKTYEKNRV